MYSMEEALFLHAINLLPQFGPARLDRLWNYFGNWELAYKCGADDLEFAGIEPEIIDIFLRHRRQVSFERELERLETEGIKLLTAQDHNYPKLLLEIPQYPHLLYYKGRMDLPDEFCLAVVGTRRISNYGRTVGPYLIQPLIDAGVTIVSGLAFGVDSQMQRLAAQSGRRTIAVLGGGLDSDSFYPSEHQLLGDQILQSGGAIISEHPIGTPPLKFNFVARNRIISGMSKGTVIIECNLKSGSLITAQFAMDHNRALFAVPGSVYNEMSQGPNNLIKKGAFPATRPEDIFEELNLSKPPKGKPQVPPTGDNAVETKILRQLSLEPLPINDIIKLTGLPAGDATAALTFLEIKGRVRNLGAQQYILSG